MYWNSSVSWLSSFSEYVEQNQDNGKKDVYKRQVSEKHDIQELKAMIAEHVAETGSPLGKDILENFVAYLPSFKKIMPRDYNRMLKEIAKAEEKGFSHEQAEVEAFYASLSH